jgi:outer membrane protein
MKNMKSAVCLMAIIASAVMAPAVFAEEGKWMVRGRALSQQVDNENSTTAIVPAFGKVQVEDKVFPEVDFTYFFTKNIAAELILTYPQKREVTLGGSRIGDVKHLPPVLTLQYHFIPEGRIRPYAGIGVNYTRFMDVQLDAGRAPQLGGAGGIPLEMERDSVGLSGQVGVDFRVAPNWFINLDAKYVDVDAEVKVKSSSPVLPGAKVTDLQLDPWLYSVGVGYRF